VFVALVMQHATRLGDYIVICVLSGPTISFLIISRKATFSEKKSDWVWSVYFDFVYNFWL